MARIEGGVISRFSGLKGGVGPMTWVAVKELKLSYHNGFRV